MSRSHIRARIRTYLYWLNTPNKHWPKEEIVKYSAVEYVVGELDKRLVCRKTMEPNDILKQFEDEMVRRYNTISEELSKCDDLVLFCATALNVIEELEVSYFDIN